MPGWLRRLEPWLGGVIAGLLFLPVVIWNAENGWVGFLRQGGRVSDWRPERAIGFLAELAGGQIGLATPGIFVLFAAGLAIAMGMTARARDPAWSLLTMLTVPPGLVFLQHALGDRVQGNWPVILYPAAAVAASGLTARFWHRLVWPSAGLGLALTILLYAHCGDRRGRRRDRAILSPGNCSAGTIWRPMPRPRVSPPVPRSSPPSPTASPPNWPGLCRPGSRSWAPGRTLGPDHAAAGRDWIRGRVSLFARNVTVRRTRRNGATRNAIA